MSSSLALNKLRIDKHMAIAFDWVARGSNIRVFRQSVKLPEPVTLSLRITLRKTGVFPRQLIILAATSKMTNSLKRTGSLR